MQDEAPAVDPTHSTRAPLGGTCPSLRQHPMFAEERSCMDLVSLVSPLCSLQARAAKEVRAVPWLLSPGSVRVLLHLAPAPLCGEDSTLPASSSPGKTANHKQLSAGKKIVRKESDEIMWMVMCSSEREEQ